MDLRQTDLIETFEGLAAFSEAVVDRGSNIISNVTLLGKVSKNKRVYSEQAMTDAVRLYEGAHFYFDHPTDREMRERKGIRSVTDLAGRIRNPRKVGDKVRGDIEVLDREPSKGLIFALAEQMPDAVGNSHRASGKVRMSDDGTQIVESLDKVFAVELVAEPATTAGLFESLQRTDPTEGTMELKDLTLEQLKSQRPDLVESVQTAVAASEELATLQTEKKALEEKLDALEVRDRERDHKALIESTLAEAKLPERFVTDLFRKQLEEAADEAAIKALIEDRKAFATGVPRGKGPKSFERDFEEATRLPAEGFAPVTEEVISEAAASLF